MKDLEACYLTPPLGKVPQETGVDTAIWLLLERQRYESYAYLNREALCRVGQAGGSFCPAVPPGTWNSHSGRYGCVSSGSCVFRVKFDGP